LDDPGRARVAMGLHLPSREGSLYQGDTRGMPLIETQDLIKEYPLGSQVVHALRGVSLTI
jgi:hypothetical protein